MPKSKKPRKAYTPQEREVNTCWDDLAGLYQSCIVALAAPAPVVQLLRDRGAVDKSRDKAQLLNDAKILQRDMSDFHQKLNDIRNQHEGFEGGTDSPDELMRALDIGEQYNQWTTSFQAVVLPIVESITKNFLNVAATVDKTDQEIVKDE